MSQAIEFQGGIAGVSTRSDKSLTIRLETPELTSEQKMLVMELQDIPCLVTFEPLEGFSVTKEIKTELSKKTQSERIRAVLFCWWSHLGEPGNFDAFYQSETEKYINAIKAKLPPQT
jgi:hypothetical protein